jgi:hypothetical protein
MKRITDTQRWQRNLGIINDFMFLTQTELMQKYDCGSEVVQRVLNKHFNLRNVGHKAEPNINSYWQSEEEMIIPEYTFNDLSESEKLIFNEL